MSSKPNIKIIMRYVAGIFIRCFLFLFMSKYVLLANEVYVKIRHNMPEYAANMNTGGGDKRQLNGLINRLTHFFFNLVCVHIQESIEGIFNGFFLLISWVSWIIDYTQISAKTEPSIYRYLWSTCWSAVIRASQVEVNDNSTHFDYKLYEY